MPKFYWSDWPFIVCLITLVFGMVLFVVMGVNLFPGDWGGRWVVLLILTGICGIIWYVNRDSKRND